MKRLDRLAKEFALRQIETGSVTWLSAGQDAFKAGYAAAVKDAQAVATKWFDGSQVLPCASNLGIKNNPFPVTNATAIVIYLEIKKLLNEDELSPSIRG